MQLGRYFVTKFVAEEHEMTDMVKQINHVWIYDRSGSMSELIGPLCEDMIEQATRLKKGDTLTICWFSGVGQNGCILKGFKISEDKDYTCIAKAIRANNTVIGTTCFSESILNLRTIVNDLLAIFSPHIAFCLFTDGYPVVDDYQKEINTIYSAIENIKNDLSATLIIGYGEIYNKNLMTTMAERVGGSLIHTDTLKDTSKTLTDFVETSTLMARSSIVVPYLNNEVVLACSLHQGRIYLYNITYPGTYSIVGHELYILQEGNVMQDNDLPLEVIYALALGLVQKAKCDIALDILNTVGDKYVMDKIINAFTNREYGEAERALLNAMNDPSARFRTGKVANYLPNENAFCLLDLLFVLMQDKEAMFYPKHPAFEYKRIGKQAKTKEGYAKFTPDKSTGVPISSLTWHKEKLNLSILVRIPGTVEVNDVEMRTFQYRNYTLIKDGILNVTKLPFSCGVETMTHLMNKGLVENVEGEIKILNLTDLPFINRAMTRNRTSAKALADHAMEALILEAKIKVYNEKRRQAIDTTPNISPVLLERGFKKDGSYAPPTEMFHNPVQDFYMAKVFKIKLKGCSTIPKVSDVERKMATNKRLNFVETQMAEALRDCHKDLEGLCKQTKQELHRIRRYIQETKFALLLSKKWFDEFDNRDDCVVTNRYGIETTFILDEEKVMVD